jgi:hypothetical protein
MDLDWQLSHLAGPPDDFLSEANGGHEMSVADIELEQVSTGGFAHLDGLAEVEEITRENGSGDLQAMPLEHRFSLL